MSTLAFFITVLVAGVLAQIEPSASTSYATTSSSSVAAQTTATLFLGPDANSDAFMGSVVDAGCGTTTYALVCTSGPFVTDDVQYCVPSQTVMVTYQPSSFVLSTQTTQGGTKGGAVATFREGCSLDGSVSAVCSATYAISVGKKKTTTSSTSTLTGTQVAYYQVPITAGASKLSGLGTSCTSSSGGAAARTIEVVRKVMVAQAAVAGVVAVLA